MQTNIQERNIAVAIILSIVTCGIYGIYWFVMLTNEANAYSEDNTTSGGVAFLLTLVTCGIYGYYWAYKMGEKLKIAQGKNGLAQKDNAVLYLILEILGLGIVGSALMQSDLNEITRSKSGINTAPQA
ncbi:MAG: DUF4234 domain-containing protein [Bacilli bacterium]|nr:DUF4234 domain-containing protein [Bacilli bacterium]